MTSAESGKPRSVAGARDLFPAADHSWVEYATDRFDELHVADHVQCAALVNAAQVVNDSGERADELFGAGSTWAVEQVNHAAEHRILRLKAHSESSPWYALGFLLFCIGGTLLVCAVFFMMGRFHEPYPVVLWGIALGCGVLSGISDPLFYWLSPRSPIAGALTREVANAPAFAIGIAVLFGDDWAQSVLHRLPGPVGHGVWPWWVIGLVLLLCGAGVMIMNYGRGYQFPEARSDRQWLAVFRQAGFHRWHLSPRTMNSMAAELQADATMTGASLAQTHGQPVDFLAGIAPVYRDSRLTVMKFSGVGYLALSVGYLVWALVLHDGPADELWVIVAFAVSVVAAGSLARSIVRMKRLYRSYRYTPETLLTDEVAADFIDDEDDDDEELGDDEAGQWGETAQEELAASLSTAHARSVVAPIVSEARAAGLDPQQTHGAPEKWAKKYFKDQQLKGHLTVRLRKTQHVRGWFALWGSAALSLLISRQVLDFFAHDFVRPNTLWEPLGLGFAACLWVVAHVWCAALHRTHTGTLGVVAPWLVKTVLCATALVGLWWCFQLPGPHVNSLAWDAAIAAISMVCVFQWNQDRYPLTTVRPADDVRWCASLRALVVDGLGYSAQDADVLLALARAEAGAAGLADTHGVPQVFVRRLPANPDPSVFAPVHAVLPLTFGGVAGWSWWQYSLTGWGIAVAVGVILFAAIAALACTEGLWSKTGVAPRVEKFVQHRSAT